MPVESKWREAITDLTRELTLLQANADYDEAASWVKKYGQVPPAMRTILDALKDIPVDVDPVYPVAASEAGALR